MSVYSPSGFHKAALQISFVSLQFLKSWKGSSRSCVGTGIQNPTQRATDYGGSTRARRMKATTSASSYRTDRPTFEYGMPVMKWRCLRSVERAMPVIAETSFSLSHLGVVESIIATSMRELYPPPREFPWRISFFKVLACVALLPTGPVQTPSFLAPDN